jgi:hypothetical protein
VTFSGDVVSQLGSEEWAVISERGCEAASLTHEEARRLVHRLAGEGRHGLCIVTDDAAGRITAPVTEVSDRVR